MTDVQKQAISAIRALSIDAIQKANSGHPGLPLGAAPMAYELYANHLKHNPENPNFENRDRFVLSAGHGSALLYSVLHLFGYDVSMDEIKNFRQFGSITSGHPEHGVCPGVETSTGPLGQGIANGVGFALAESILAAKYNKKGLPLVDHYTYVLTGDGCLQEGIACEAASLAGTLGLGKLIVLYDKNDITIEGNISIAFSEDVGARHRAQGWQTLYVENGEDIESLGKAIEEAKAEKDKPSIIIVKTVIGYASPKAGSSSCHGSPLGDEGVKATKEALGYNYPPFTVPDEVRAHYAALKERGVQAENEFIKIKEKYAQKYPELFAEYCEQLKGEYAIDRDALYEFDGAISTRKASQVILNKLAEMIPFFIGGSADLGPSNLTVLSGQGDYSKENRLGRNLHFGIREHAMAAIINGMYLHGGFLPYCATFFSFSDYMKNAVRMSAIMKLPVIYVFTHDSIGVGEDGPTHQPIEHLTGLRAMPDLNVFRPADGRETAAAYESALGASVPTALVASRQDLPALDGTGDKALRGGYVLSDDPNFAVILLAAGSEVSLALEAKKLLNEQGVAVRVVSMPCFRIFDSQSEEYKESVLPSSIRARVAIEAGSSLSWYKYAGLDGEYVCLDEFGQSAPAKKLFAYYGFTAENVAEKALAAIKKNGSRK